MDAAPTKQRSPTAPADWTGVLSPSVTVPDRHQCDGSGFDAFHARASIVVGFVPLTRKRIV